MEITLPHNFQPRNYQLSILKALDSDIKRAVWIVHRRGGKDKTLWNMMIKKAHERIGIYYYLLPTYAQARKIIWDGIDRDGFKFLDHIPDVLVKSKNIADMKIDLKCGSIIQLVGTDNYNSIVGTNPVGCVFSEFALQDPMAWGLIRPILAENDGWAVFNYTPRGKNHGWDLYNIAKQNNWFHEVLTVNDTKREDGTPVITPEMIEEERRTGMDEDLIQQEYFCSFSGAISGSYYGKQMKDLEAQGRMLKGLYEPTCRVQTWWDLGMDDSMSILFTQVIGREIRFIDYFESSGEGLAYYAKILADKPYVYECHNFPHDASVRELGTGKSREEVAKSLGIRPLKVVPRVEKKEDGIQAVRSILPRVWIDIEKCKRLIDALLNYSHEYDEKNKCWKPTPKHSWASHGNDSVQTFALGYKDVMIEQFSENESYSKYDLI